MSVSQKSFSVSQRIKHFETYIFSAVALLYQIESDVPELIRQGREDWKRRLRTQEVEEELEEVG